MSVFKTNLEEDKRANNFDNQLNHSQMDNSQIDNSQDPFEILVSSISSPKESTGKSFLNEQHLYKDLKN